MQRTHIYLPEALNAQIDLLATMQRKSKSEIIRTALEHGIKAVQPKQSNSGKALFEMAKRAEKIGGRGPRDLSINHDYYTWGGPRRVPLKKVQ